MNVQTFTKSDWDGYAGAEPGVMEPMIAHNNTRTVVVDANGVQVLIYVNDFAFKCYQYNTNNMHTAELIARGLSGNETDAQLLAAGFIRLDS